MERGAQGNYVFLANGEEDAGHLSFADLDRRARAVAAVLQESGTGREPVLLLFPSGLEFVSAFCACLYAGVVAVPAYPPGSSRGLGRLHAILDDARPRRVLTTTSLRRRVCAALAPASSGGPEVLAVDEVPDEAASGWRDPESGGDDLAFLQYTSGSTSTPRGVMVTHANLMHNERIIQRAFEQDERSLVVSWLPLYHDMGLIGAVLQPLFTGAGCVLMPPASFLQKPRRWLDAISRYRADTSGGPSFAYDLCVDKIPEEERDGLDLSSWRIAFNGAEPVRPGTLRRFAEAFSGCGFRSSSMRPCYGLAEATLMVSGARPAERTEPVVLDLDADAMARGEVAASRPGEKAARLSGSGAVAGAEPSREETQEVRIVDPESGIECASGRVGEIWVSGPSVAAGYWRRGEESAEVFGASLAGVPERTFLRTGDLGFLRGDELFVTGRLKDLLILRGRNHYPQDLELTAERSHPALRPGCGAAFAISAGGEERAAIVHELERKREEEAEAAAAALTAAIALEHEVHLHEVVLLRRGGLPKTTSGKVRRRACRELWLAGELPVVWSREQATETPAAPALTAETLLAAPAADRLALLTGDLRTRVAVLLGTAPEKVPSTAPVAALGLDSLRSMELRNAVEESFGAALGVAEVLDATDLSALAIRVLDALSADAAVVSPSEAPARSPGSTLSAGQRALWFLHRLAPDSAAYHLAAAFRVRGPLSRTALSRALEALIDRHPVLRTEIVEERGGPVPRRREGVGACLRWIEAPEAGETELLELAAREAWRPFDLAEAPLLRAAVIAGAGERHLVLSVHHAVADLWSLAILLGDLEHLYREGDDDEAAPLPALPPPALSYGDFAAWQEAMLAGPAGDAHWRYWRQELGGAPPELALPTDRPRPATQSFRGAARSRRLDAELTDALAALARERGTTLFAGLLAGLDALLHRYTGEDDLRVGSPAAGRPSAAWSDVVGYFVNPVVLRAALGPATVFAELVDQARDKVVAALRHQDLPFPLLVERLCPDREPSRNPLFQVMLVLHQERLGGRHGLGALAAGVPGGALRLGPLDLEALPLETRAAQVDLSLVVSAREGALHLTLQYATDLFDGTTAERMLRHYETLLSGAVVEPSRTLRELPLLDRAERTQLLGEWNATPADLSGPLPIHELFEAQARRTPDAVAVVHGGVSLSYRALAARAARLARHLRTVGVGPEVPVGILLDRDPDLVTALLGVLQAGGAYVPLDPAYPGSRLAHYLEDSGAPVLVSRRDLVAALPARAGGRRVLLDAEAAEIASRPGTPLGSSATAHNLAYVIYTSGSTGRPKGVAIEHRSAAVFLHWAGRHFDDGALSAVLAATSICFDLSVFEIFAPLVHGGSVVLVDSALALAAPDPPEVSLVNTVPSLLAESLRVAPLPASVRTVNLAGEPLPASLVERIGRLGTVERLENLYGPSESTTYSTVARVPWHGDRPPAIGRPVTGTQAYVADPGLAPLPAGVPGQLLLGGAGLARGYLGRPALTAERFLPDPFGSAPGGRLYRTGDLCRLRADGELEFLGRFDHQVKVRGFRIELGEVAAEAEALPEVAEAVAVVREDRPGDRRLVLYAVPTPSAEGEPATDPEALREALRPRLPSFMLPSAWVALDALPRTPNGKVDRLALPSPPAPATTEGEAPRGEIEIWLAGAWSELLGTGPAGRGDDFFRLGGHSLLAVRLAAWVRRELGVELPLADVFAEPTLAGLARRIEELGRSSARDPILPAPRGVDLPLSFPQQRLWFLHRMAPTSPAYHMAGAIRVSGPLDLDALRRAFAEIVRRHQVLSTRFPELGGVPRQVPGPPAVPELLEARGTDLETLLLAEARRPFDLAHDAPLRLRFLRTGADRHAVVVVLHHIAADGWSVEILLRELEVLYGAFAAGQRSPLAEPPVQYADFAHWQRQRLDGPALDALLTWWREHLAGAPPALDLTVDRPRPQVASQRGGTCRRVLADETSAALSALGRGRGATPFVTLLAGLGALLGRYTEEDDLLVGSPMANRLRPEVQELIGCFVNLLALRVDLAGDPGFGELVERVRDEAAAALARQELPFERLVESLAADGVLSHDPARPPLVQVVLAVEHAPDESRLPGLEVERLPLDLGTARFDLTLFATLREGGRVELTLEYASDLFDRASGERFLGHLGTLLAAAAADPGRPVGALPLTTGAEERQLLHEWNRTDAEPPAGNGVHEWVARWAERAPDAVALVAGSRVVSYGALHRLADRLARRLAALGAGPESVVAICSERSADAVSAALAVLRAGAAYLPLDPANPVDRLAFMARDAGATLVLLGPGAPAADEWVPPGAQVLSLVQAGADEAVGAALGHAGSPDGAAYVIYTSGSTGRPKGVVTSHRGLLNLVTWHHRVHELAPGDRATHLAAPGFDAAVWEIWSCLAAGATLHLPDDAVRAVPADLVRWLERERITASFLPTPLAEAVLGEPWSAGAALRVVLTGGDRLRTAPPAGLPFRLVNHYGPTESSVVATFTPVEPGEPGPPPIGRPVDNVRAYVADGRLSPVPVGLAGELCLGGSGLARGYLGAPARTAERFVPDPWSGRAGERLYRTGDRVRRAADGSLRFLGRGDQQVKVRGFRIELGEIEAALRSHPGVAEALVQVVPMGQGAQPVPADPEGAGALLAAWVVPAGDGVAGAEPGDLREHLETRLPGYMVPAAFVRLDALPLTRNGKVDRRALPAPELASREGRPFVPPGNAVEELVAEIYGELLGVERVSADDSFFALGGNSLLVARLVSRVRDELGIDVPLRDLFEGPTVASLTATLSRIAADQAATGSECDAGAGTDPDAEVLEAVHE